MDKFELALQDMEKSNNKMKVMEDALLRVVKNQTDTNNALERLQSQLIELNETVQTGWFITPQQANHVQRRVKERLKHLSEAFKVNYFMHRNRLFAAMWGDVKNTFNVPTYREVQRRQFELLLDYVNSWNGMERLIDEWIAHGLLEAG